MRRTPEIAAFGYVLERADVATKALWIEGIEHLRGREIYPPDRQTFILNPIEILGIASGVAIPSVPLGYREWFSATVQRGITQGHFRTSLSRQAAQVALQMVEADAASKHPIVVAEYGELVTSDLILSAAMSLAFGSASAGEEARLERALLRRILAEPLSIADAVEASAVGVVARRAIDRVQLASHDATAEERIVALCRRFPLFVQRLQSRQRNRAPFRVDDEYDVQDLLHGILALHFDDVRPEEYTPSYAGNSSRVDFFLPRERIVIEAKMTRSNMGQREVANQLAIDAARYAQMSTVDTLICLVYDPGRHCGNPVSLESDVEASKGRLKVRAVVCPHGV